MLDFISDQVGKYRIGINKQLSERIGQANVGSGRPVKSIDGHHRVANNTQTWIHDQMRHTTKRMNNCG